MGEKKKSGRPSVPVNPITAERIKKLRHRAGKSQEEFAEEMGCCNYTISRYESAKRGLTEDALEKYAAYFNVPVEYLTGETDCDTFEAYQTELWKIEAEVVSELQAEEEKETEQLNAFFTMCGFRYGYNRPELYGSKPHLLTDPKTGIAAELDSTELFALMDRIRSVIQLEAFIKSKHKKNSAPD